MRFIVLAVTIIKGIYRGICNEVKKLAKQTRVNELKKHKIEELNEEYRRLGEYWYYNRDKVVDERMELLVNTISQILEEIEGYEQRDE